MAKRKRQFVIDEVRVEPTPETVAKLRPDRLAHLPAELQRAGWCIEIAYRHITDPVACRTADYGAPKISGDGRRGGESEAMIDHLGSYNDWVDEMKRYSMPVGAALDMIIEGFSNRQAERRYGMRNGALGPLLQESLALYARMRWG